MWDQAIKDKRGSWRLDLAIEGTARLIGTDGLELDRKIITKNVSGGGTYALSDSSCEIGDQFVLWLPVGGDGDSQTAIGTVLRVEQVSEDTYGFAVRFESPFSLGH
ncbi:MAG: hypothetical protein ACR2L2_03120 [Acidobacteriota bacterium]